MTGDGRRDQIEKPLQGAVICCTAVPPKQRTHFAKIVEEMGGEHNVDLVKVGHPPTAKHLTAKYKYVAANSKGIRVLQPAWLETIHQSWMTGEKFNLQALEEGYKLPIFAGLSICITGFKDLTFRVWLQESIIAHGGDYLEDLTKDVTHLIANAPEGKKYQYAEQWHIQVVSLCWFKDCLDRGMVQEESLYHPFEEQEKARNREAKAKALLGKRPRDENSTQEAPRKRRRTEIRSSDCNTLEFYDQHHQSLLDARQRMEEDESESDSEQVTFDTQERPPPMKPESMIVDLACTICKEHLVDTVVMPCMHAVMCNWCAELQIPGKRGTPHLARDRTAKCPLCRARVKEKRKIFHS